MNHDYTHCLDWEKNCPKSCFRAQITRELKEWKDLTGIPLSWSHFKDTDECEKRRMKPKAFEVIYKITITSSVPFPSTLNWNIESVGELIRCKDCKCWKQSMTDITEHVCHWGGFQKNADDYCSWAERKEE